MSYQMKTVLLVLVALFALGTGTGMASDQNTEKAIRKECKKRSKQMEKEGWRVYNQTLSLEQALADYELKRSDGFGDSYSIIASGTASSERSAISKAETDAKAQRLRMEHESKVDNTTTVNQVNVQRGDSVKSITEIRSETADNAKAKIKPMRPELTLIRKTDKGMTEVRMYYIIDSTR